MEDRGSLAAVLHQFQAQWERRHRPNVALFHYADFQADLPGELQRLGEVLGYQLSHSRAEELASYATFDTMRSRAFEFAPNTTDGIWKDNERFFRAGRGGDWDALFTQAEHFRYRHRINELAPGDVLAWAHEGRRGCDPSG